MKLWAGRFQKETDDKVNDFNSSISFDARLYRQDIAGSIAHATMLGEQGIIAKEEADKIVATLKILLEEIEAGKVEFTKDSEDIHMNMEVLLTERIGATGKRLHTGRSRNDQVALDKRLYVKKEIKEIIEWERLCVMMRSRVLASHAVSSATIDDVFSTVSGDL